MMLQMNIHLNIKYDTHTLLSLMYPCIIISDNSLISSM